MTKACVALAFFCLALALPLQAFDWETATVREREYVSLHSFCAFYSFPYSVPSGNDRFTSRNAAHSISFKLGTSDMYLDGVHYVMSFPIEGGDHDWLVSKMDVIKLFEPILRPTEISGRHTIRGVVIDPGHGGSDNGATSRLGTEKEYTLDTAFRLEKILRDAGLKTVLTRRTDVFVDLYERAHIASLYSNYAFVSIHYNSATEEARGLETYCLSPRGAASTSSAYLTRGDIQKLPGNDYDTQNILLASMVHSEIIRLNPGDSTADRGVKRARFVVIKQNVLPAILVEGGFVSNHMESARVNRPDYRQSLAEAIARGIIRFANSMGDRNMPLPSGGPDDNAPTPRTKPVAVAPPAPSGLAAGPGLTGTSAAKKKTGNSVTVATPAASSAGTSAARKKAGSSVSAGTASTSSTGTPAVAKGRKAKTRKPAVTPVSTPVPPSSPQTHTVESSQGPINPSAPATNAAPASAPSAAPLNLTEPAIPAPTPGADKAPAEPDEPPTVTIYSSTPKPAPKAPSTNAPAANAPAPSTPAPSGQP